jgi:enamine deaminase RidA (YjgF/YER057c/UK114 family)
VADRFFATAVLAACLVGAAGCPAAEQAAANDKPANEATLRAAAEKQTARAAVQYLPLDASAGMSQAVIVQGLPLVYTRQLQPLDGDGKLVGPESADRQIGQVLASLEAVLHDAGSGLDKLVRVNVYALSPAIAAQFCQQLSKRLGPTVRPAITPVLTPLPHRKAMVAADAVAVTASKRQRVAFGRCEYVHGEKDCADTAVMPPGGVAYLSGRPEEGGLAVSAVARSLSAQLKILDRLRISPAQVVQVKVFLKPAAAADDVLGEVKKFFPGVAPPVVFVEWLAAVPVEIELIAQLPPADKSAPSVEYYNPPDMMPSPSFSRVALVHSQRQIFVSGLLARAKGKGEAQADDVFDQLQAILEKTGSDMRHLVKATYYVVDDDASRGIDKARYEFLDPKRPPAASKVAVHGMGQSGRTLTIDMIAAGSGD